MLIFCLKRLGKIRSYYSFDSLLPTSYLHWKSLAYVVGSNPTRSIFINPVEYGIVRQAAAASAKAPEQSHHSYIYGTFQKWTLSLRVGFMAALA